MLLCDGSVREGNITFAFGPIVTCSDSFCRRYNSHSYRMCGSTALRIGRLRRKELCILSTHKWNLSFNITISYKVLKSLSLSDSLCLSLSLSVSLCLCLSLSVRLLLKRYHVKVSVFLNVQRMTSWNLGNGMFKHTGLDSQFIILRILDQLDKHCFSAIFSVCLELLCI